MNPELKQLWQDLKQSPAILITLLVAVGLVIWYIYSQNNSGSTSGNAGLPTYEVESISVTPPASSSGSSGSSSGTGSNNNGNPDSGFYNHTHLPGTTFTGPTGVKHYVTTGNETLTQIAQKLGLQSWNNIYAIPENKKNNWVPSGLTATQAASYKPAPNVPLVY